MQSLLNLPSTGLRRCKVFLAKVEKQLTPPAKKGVGYLILTETNEFTAKTKDPKPLWKTMGLSKNGTAKKLTGHYLPPIISCCFSHLQLSF